MTEVSQTGQAAEVIKVELAFVAAGRVHREILELPVGTTLEQALRQASRHVPAGQMQTKAVSVFGRRRPLDEVLHDGDRIELLEPLSADPKDARQRRVAKKRAELIRDRWRGSS